MKLKALPCGIRCLLWSSKYIQCATEWIVVACLITESGRAGDSHILYVMMPYSINGSYN